MNNLIDLTKHFEARETRGAAEEPWKAVLRLTPRKQAQKTVALLRQVSNAAQDVLERPLDDFDRETLWHLINQAVTHLDDVDDILCDDLED